jgi:hypothetical protein
MRKPTTAAISLAWFVAIGGTFGGLLPYLLNDWPFRRPLPCSARTSARRWRRSARPRRTWRC